MVFSVGFGVFAGRKELLGFCAAVSVNILN